MGGMATQPGGMSGRVPNAALQLSNPRSLAVYDSYDDAQHAVDYLSDRDFAVQNVLIVGTDLRQVERVTGRMSVGKAIMGGALSGMWLGLMVGLLMSFFSKQDWGMTVLSSVVAGGFFFAIWAAIGYGFTQGKRDFTSVSQVIATRYEILVEHEHFDHAHRILRGGTSTQESVSDRAATERPAPEREAVRSDPERPDDAPQADAQSGAHPAGQRPEQGQSNPWSGPQS